MFKWFWTIFSLGAPETLVNKIKQNQKNNDLGVVHPRSASSSTWFQVELEFGNLGFWWREGKTGVTDEKQKYILQRKKNPARDQFLKT